MARLATRNKNALQLRSIKVDNPFPADWLAPSVTAAQVDLWQIDLIEMLNDYDAFLSMLSSDETTRANRFRRTSDRERFICTRGVLRMLLGRYLAIPPTEIRFDYGNFGKPRLATDAQPLFFSVTHSMHSAGIGISRSSKLGIDWEFAERIKDADNLSKFALSARELLLYQQLNISIPSQKVLFLLERWTLKEAYLKALGKGLSVPLNDIDLQQNNEFSNREFELRHRGVFRQQWKLRSIFADDESQLALAVKVKRTANFPAVKLYQLPYRADQSPAVV
jgi:4'-phosphopantetheinyl transferase